MKFNRKFYIKAFLFILAPFVAMAVFQNCAKIDYKDDSSGSVSRLSASQLVDLDSDADGLPDSIESDIGTNINLADTDGDGLSDGAEVNVHQTNPLDADTDKGGLRDGVEVTQGKNPNDPADDKSNPNAGDSDQDGLSDQLENQLGTNTQNPDTDGDGLQDGAEHLTYRTNPRNSDTDDGGVKDGEEVNQGTNPLLAEDDLKLVCIVGSGRYKNKEYECPAHQRFCNNGGGNGSETCSPSPFGNKDE